MTDDVEVIFKAQAFFDTKTLKISQRMVVTQLQEIFIQVDQRFSANSPSDLQIFPTLKICNQPDHLLKCDVQNIDLYFNRSGHYNFGGG